jgi:hypothetical protein
VLISHLADLHFRIDCTTHHNIPPPLLLSKRSKLILTHTYTLHYRVLETLDLACNYFNSEPAIEAATRLPRVGTIKLYGNPILGETGEDPIYIYIEGNCTEQQSCADRVMKFSC